MPIPKMDGRHEVGGTATHAHSYAVSLRRACGSALSRRQANPVHELARARRLPFFCIADTLDHWLRSPRAASNARRFRGRFQTASRYPPEGNFGFALTLNQLPKFHAGSVL